MSTHMVLQTQIVRSLEIAPYGGGVKLSYQGPAGPNVLGSQAPPVEILLNNQQANDLLKAIKGALTK